MLYSSGISTPCNEVGFGGWCLFWILFTSSMTFFMVLLTGPLYHKHCGEFMNVPLMVLHLVFFCMSFWPIQGFSYFPFNTNIEGEVRKGKEGRKENWYFPALSWMVAILSKLWLIMHQALKIFLSSEHQYLSHLSRNGNPNHYNLALAFLPHDYSISTTFHWIFSKRCHIFFGFYSWLAHGHWFPGRGILTNTLWFRNLVQYDWIKHWVGNHQPRVWWSMLIDRDVWKSHPLKLPQIMANISCNLPQIYLYRTLIQGKHHH